MRVKEEFKRNGVFWLPSSPRTQVPGILSISDGGEVKLELTQPLDSSSVEALFDYSDQTILGRILGHVDKDGPVIIDRCYHMSKTRNIVHGGLIASDVILANRAFMTFSDQEDESPRFNTVTFSVEGIDEWIGISGIEVDPQFENSALTILYNRPEDVTLSLENGMQLQITFAWTPPGLPATKRAEVTQKIYFRLVSQEPHELDVFISVAEKIAAFLCFIIDEIVCLDEVIATADNRYQETHSGTPVKIYCSSWPYSKDEPEIQDWRILFRFKKIQNRAESIINSWMESWGQVAPAFDLYFLTKTGRIGSRNLQFLTLVQALEAFHRTTSNEKHMDEDKFKEIRKQLIKVCPKEERNWFAQKLNYANELNLKNRLDIMTKPFDNFMGGEYRSKLIESIKDTRNYLTHYDPCLAQKAVEGQSLKFLIIKMNALFRLHFLKLIGFDEQEIGAIVDECLYLKDACSMVDRIYAQA